MSSRVESAFTELPPLPDVATRLIAAVNVDQVGTAVIVGILRTDAALTAEVLRRANSPAYGLTARVSSLAQAVMMLGLAEIRRMATSISLGRHFSAGKPIVRRLWRHALVRALVAERIARVAGSSPEISYSAGLLADIGVYGLLVNFPGLEQAALERATDDAALLASESREFGTNHCEAGEWLARRWCLPEPIVDAIGSHHNPPGAAVNAGGHVYLADYVVTCLAFGYLGTQMTRQADLDGYRRIREQAPLTASALPEDAEELFAWLVARVPS